MSGELTIRPAHSEDAAADVYKRQPLYAPYRALYRTGRGGGPHFEHAAAPAAAWDGGETALCLSLIHI